MDQTPAFKITCAAHTGFVVSSLEDATRFWVEGLGATFVRNAEAGGEFLANVTGAHGASVNAAIVEIAGCIVELLEYHNAPPPVGPAPAPFNPGAAHLALNVSDLDAALARAAQFGWHAWGVPQMIDAGPRSGTRVMYIRGPDGEAVELIEPPKLANVTSQT
jgi:catechol 2,3-dioxygenase-like lactoylglutathione lyase family enzyme